MFNPPDGVLFYFIVWLVGWVISTRIMFWHELNTFVKNHGEAPTKRQNIDARKFSSVASLVWPLLLIGVIGFGVFKYSSGFVSSLFKSTLFLEPQSARKLRAEGRVTTPSLTERLLDRNGMIPETKVTTIDRQTGKLVSTPLSKHDHVYCYDYGCPSHGARNKVIYKSDRGRA